MNYLERAKELMPELVEHRRNIHQHPELGLNCENTATYVTQKLKEMGYDPQPCGKSGVVATVGKPGGKVFLLRADMDALPLQEESGLEFASVNPGAAHCCGHDVHTAMLLGAARLLKENEEELCGIVKLMFQPGEETLEGAREMIAHGVLENPRVDAAMAIHINALLPTGRLFVPYGPMTASSDKFSILVKGHGGHGARPHESIDPINAACHIHTALQVIHARELVAGETAVMTIGSIHGGNANNIIPETVEMKGTIRTYSNEVRKTIKDRIEEISASVAHAFRAEAQVTFDPGYSVPMICDESLAKMAAKSINELVGEGTAVNMSKKQTASEDFAFVTDQVPGSFMILGAAIQPKVEYGQHHPKVRYDESCMPIGAAAEAYVATQWLKQN